jgi:hypothetical protein
MVNIALPIELALPPSSLLKTQRTAVTTAPIGYGAASTSLSQVLGRMTSYLAQHTISLFTLIHFFGEMQDWSDTLPESLRRPHLTGHAQVKAINFLSLRWFDAIMVATKPFLASLARFGIGALSARLRNFFTFCANVASVAAREALSLMKQMKSQQLIKGLTAFDRHFLVQCAGILALSSVVQMGKRDERLRFRECIEMLLHLPGGRYGYLIREMREVETKLERYAATKGTKSPYNLPRSTLIYRDSANIFHSPGLPSFSVKSLLHQFVGASGQNGNGEGPEDKEENLARWIPRRVLWEDILEHISAGLKREGFVD